MSRALAVALAVAACGHRDSPSRLAAIVDEAVAKDHLGKLAVAVVDHGRLVLDRQVGATRDTVFAIGSLTKQFTAAAILRLVDEGKLAWTDRAVKYLPQLHSDATIAQLVWQTAGLAEYAYGEHLGKSADELLAVIAAAAPQFAPGTSWAYSNANYFVLGRIVEVASGQAYATYLRDHVLSRAGLTATAVCGPSAHVLFDVTLYGGAGELCSTVPDLLRWQDALFGGRVLSPASLALVTTPGKLDGGAPIDYAAGLVVDRVGSHRRIWHNGGVPGGLESELAWYPDDRLQIVLLATTDGGAAGLVLGNLDRALAREALHVPAAVETDQPIERAALARYTGSYKAGPLDIAVTIDGDHLHVKVSPNGLDAKMLYQGDDRFAPAGKPSVVYRFVVAAGTASSIDITADGSPLATATRAN